MKTRIALLAALALAAVGYAASEPIVELVSSIRPTWFQSGIYLGPASANPLNDTQNKLTRTLAASATTLDFASTTITCNILPITVTGAQTGDICDVGVPSTGGSTNASYTCYVSAANTVQVRHCAAGTADDPASAVFSVRVFSNQ